MTNPARSHHDPRFTIADYVRASDLSSKRGPMEPMGPTRSTTPRVETRIFAGAAATLLILGACTSGPDSVGDRPGPEASDTTEASAVKQQIRVTRDTDRGPEVCRPQQVGETVVDHFDAINEGDADRAMNFVTPERGWYSVTEGNPRDQGRHFVARDSGKLRDYLHERVRQEERIYLVEIDVDYERASNIAHVAYGFHRTALDLADYAPEGGGKGAIDCDTGLISVWSMAHRNEVVPLGDLCPGGSDPPRIALACART